MATQRRTQEGQYPPIVPKSLAFKLAFLSLCACNFISILDTVIVAAALPVIAVALNSTSGQAYWCGTGFLFAATVCQPVYGALSEVFGRKLCLVVALSIFTIGSILCATAQNISWLITARIVSTSIILRIERESGLMLLLSRSKDLVQEVTMRW